MELQLNIGSFSDVGKVREINEDYFGSFSGSFGYLLLVCDGMGGHKDGEIASRIAVKSIKNHFEEMNRNYDPPKEIYDAFNSANNSIIQTAFNDSTLSDMGSTVVLVLLKDGLVHYANLGDSRIYRIRQGKILQLTKDNSLVQQMIDSNMITENEAKTHPKKHVITKALGIDPELEPEIYQPFKLQENDIIILCSDGLTEHVEEKEILKLAGNNSVSDAAIKLVDLANERGGSDNITVQVARAGVPYAVGR
ncbi:MAG: Stp1/IreP family PP2C-type Ser/Thr phosphatase [Bacteroidetes bacterium]|nr:Stp1/IreP family PP2C-type Ser/Thr phosphatase [Bacteroidota bacterium]